MNLQRHKTIGSSFSTSVEPSLQSGQVLLDFGISETDWTNLLDHRGNKTKALAWIESRLQEVCTLSREAQKSYLHVMLKNLLMDSDKQ
ncbi:hypothetical protein [Acidithiobacillus sp.]|uniref:hypothetical protein n=1 Tax=Acidithiobacillus sp. TaxID=1872118 RepID=UPI0026051909|nr:hypothetical protein [Acidithiobacillus sp.]MDD2751416.1 hypothetical protein [Acidithiobacillus sp.]MDD5280805.1 hypothetical protein [Acidithiobacillus sp.]